MSLLLILQTFFVVAAATRGQGYVPAEYWPVENHWPADYFHVPETITDDESLKKDIMTIESNMLCYIYDICNTERTEFISSIVADEKESEEFYVKLKDLMEEKYGTRFSTVPSDTELSEKGRGRLTSILADLMGSLSSQFFECKHKNKDYNYDISMFNRSDLMETATLYETYFVNATRAQEASERTEELFEMHSKHRKRSSYRFGQYNIHRSANSLNDEVSKIKDLYSLLIAYIFGCHPSNFADLYPRFNELKKYGIGPLVAYRNFLEKSFGDVLKKYKATLREDPTDVPDKLYFVAEKEIRDYWVDQIAMLKGKEPDYFKKWYKEKLQHRIRYFLKFASVEQMNKSRKRLTEIRDLTLRNSSPSASPGDSPSYASQNYMELVNQVVDQIMKRQNPSVGRKSVLAAILDLHLTRQQLEDMLQSLLREKPSIFSNGYNW